MSGHLYGEVFLGYEILHGWVSLNDELHAGGVASLATSSSIVVGLLHRQVQLDLRSTWIIYAVVCDTTPVNLGCYMFCSTQHKVGFRGVASVDIRL